MPSTLSPPGSWMRTDFPRVALMSRYPFVRSGMTSRELLEAVRRICLELPIVGIDIVEVAPPFDSADITAILANRVVLEALSAIAKRRNGSVYNPTQNLLDR